MNTGNTGVSPTAVPPLLVSRVILPFLETLFGAAERKVGLAFMKNARDSEGPGVKPRWLRSIVIVATPRPLDRQCGGDHLFRPFLAECVSWVHPTPVRTWVWCGLRVFSCRGTARAQNALFFSAHLARTRLVCPGHGTHFPIELNLHDRCMRHVWRMVWSPHVSGHTLVFACLCFRQCVLP